MDSKSIQITTYLSVEDLRRVLFRQIKTKLIIIGSILFIFVLFVVLGIAVNQMSKNNMPLTFFVPILIPILIFSFSLFSLIWAVSSQARRMGENIEQTEYIFNEQGMEAESASTSVKTLWTKFYKVKENETDFLIYIQKNIAIPIPKRVFISENQIVEFRNLLSEKLGGKTKLKN